MKKLACLLLLIIAVAFTFNACSTVKKHNNETKDDQYEVLEDVDIKDNQSIDEYVEDEVEDFNEKGEERANKYKNALKDSDNEEEF